MEAEANADLGPRYACRLSQATYDKLKQASSLLADNPSKRGEINKVYRKLMEYQNRLEKMKQYGEGEGDAKEAARLEANQEALIRDYLKLAERFGKKAFAQAEATAARDAARSSTDRTGRIPVASTEAWADIVDSEDEEEPFIYEGCYDHDHRDDDRWDDERIDSWCEGEDFYLHTLSISFDEFLTELRKEKGDQ